MSEFTDAIREGNSARVTELVAADPALLQARENDVTPTLLALYHGKSDIARLLVARGAPLSFAEACALGELDAARRMLADDPSLLDRRSSDGYPPLGLAIFFRQPEVARFLIEAGADVNAFAQNANAVAPVHAAAAVCDRETMRLLLERGADVHARQQLDYTAMHGCASRGDIETAKLLLAHGALRDARGADGMTAADVARKYGQPAFAEWIESL